VGLLDADITGPNIPMMMRRGMPKAARTTASSCSNATA
jgi:Mrp family chromosome partitioning ATPase